MNIIKRHTRTKIIMGEKYIFTGKCKTLVNAQRMAKKDRSEGYNVRIFKLLTNATDYVWRVYTTPKKKR